MAGAICALGILFQGCASTRLPSGPCQGNEEAGFSLAVVDPYATQVPVFDAERLQLTSDYNRQHYGRSGFSLTDPRMIVVHYTAIASLPETLRFFKSARLDQAARRDIASGGDVNVSAHYVVDSNGDIYQLAPENVICRHTIGFNYTAIAIENVAADAGQLTERQARATAALVCRILGRHPTIRYLIGHHEYRDSTLPHYRLLVEKQASYRFTDKIDPGPQFMARVRELLEQDYGVTLAD